MRKRTLGQFIDELQLLFGDEITSIEFRAEKTTINYKKRGGTAGVK